MSTNRLVFSEWIVELGRDPSRLNYFDPNQDESPRTAEIRAAVQEALAGLDEDERELIERHHYMGQPLRQIAEDSGRQMHRLESMHKRSLRKIRIRLEPLVREKFGMQPLRPDSKCPICGSPDRARIDRLIAGRDPQATWRPIMRQIREEFGLNVTSPQTLIGHSKYH